MRRAQISIEYVIIVGVVVFLVVIPAAIFLSSFAQNSLFGTVADETARELGDGLTSAAQQVYYLGLYAKQRVVLPVPRNVERFFLLKLEEGDTTYHYIVIQTSDGSEPQNYIYQSDVPLWSDVAVTGTSAKGVIPECAASPSCETIVFNEKVRRPGDRQFLLETVKHDGQVKVKISPVVS